VVFFLAAYFEMQVARKKWFTVFRIEDYRKIITALAKTTQ